MCNRNDAVDNAKNQPNTDAGCVREPCLEKKCDAAVTIGRVRRGNPYVPKNANAADGMPDSVPPTKTYEVEVIVTPSLESCPGQYIELSIINGSADNGTATVSPTRITKTSTVTVTGGDQTKPGHAGKLKIQAKLDGTTVKAESAGFTVCAHPQNWRNTFSSDIDGPDGVGVAVQDDWDSDSDTFTHLDQTEISEKVRQGTPTSPPFPTLASVTIRNTGYLPGDQKTVDTHTSPRPTAGPVGTWEKTQLSLFKCKRCGTTDKVQPSSGLKVIHEVFKDGAQWKHKTRKVGAAVTIGANTTQAGTANVTSLDHNLP